VRLWLLTVGRPRVREAAARHLADRPDQAWLHAIEGSAALARPAPPSARQPSPQPANPANLPALLAVPEPAQPARLGVAIKEPPPVRLITSLGFRRVSVAVRHSILPAADGRRRPPAWRLGASGGRRIRRPTATRGSSSVGRPPMSYLPRRGPSISVLARHNPSACDEGRHGQGESGRPTTEGAHERGTPDPTAARR
jgi:hypothetical protein